MLSQEALLETKRIFCHDKSNYGEDFTIISNIDSNVQGKIDN